MPRIIMLALAVLLVAVPTAHAFDTSREAQNYVKTQERQAIYQSVQGEAQLRQVGAANAAHAAEIQLTDPERVFPDLCGNGFDGCTGDARLYDWQSKGYGIVQPVLYTARDGATISGHIWATRAGPAKRPGVVITNGSVQAVESFYWFIAQTLAKAGYVVMTFDPQGQGQSDTLGEGADAREGVPAQTDGRPFYDGIVDALDFFLSSKQHPYVPRTSCETGTSHAAKQERRVKAGLDSAANPFAELLDPSRVGIAGHSYAAGGVSYVGQSDPRVKAIVAYDNLGQPVSSGGTGGGEQPCPADPSRRAAAPITKPALGMSADYSLVPQPYTADPDPLAKSAESLDYTKAGVDSGELVIRGGTHYEFSFISNPAFGATLRGADLAAWYTTAWMDKYVKGDPAADARLLSDRWRRDAAGAAVDPNRDANLFSFYYRSRLDLHRSDGTAVDCEDLRAGCPTLSADDGVDGEYSYLTTATSPDGAATTSVPAAAGLPSTVKAACTSRRTIVIHVPHAKGVSVRRVRAYVGTRRVGSSRGSTVRVTLRGLPKTTATVRLKLTVRRGGKPRSLTIQRRYKTCRPKG